MSEAVGDACHEGHVIDNGSLSPLPPLGPGHVDSNPFGSCILDGDFIEEVHTPILRCHVNTLAFGSPERACKAAGDCGGRGCPVPVQNKNSAHCPIYLYIYTCIQRQTDTHTYTHTYVRTYADIQTGRSIALPKSMCSAL